MRKYKETNPWLAFELDLRKATFPLWILLGEARSQIEHIAGVPLQESTATQLHKLYLAKGVRATTAIEGNTLTEEEVLQQLQGNLKLPPSRQYLAREVDNMAKMCGEIGDGIMKGAPSDLTPETIKRFNQRVLEGLAVAPEVQPGELRKHSVVVGGYRAAPAEDCSFLLEQMCSWLQGEAFRPPKDELKVVFAILKAIVAHLYIAWIHPFGDGNGRTARLIEFQILVASGVPSPAAHLLSNHYNLTRSEYYRHLDEASRSGGEIVPFIHYAVEGLVDGLRSQLERIRDQQWLLAWKDYVEEQFRSRKTTTADLKRKMLVLDLSHEKEAVPADKLASLTPRVAAAYARKTRKTLSRDINLLVSMGLIRQVVGGYVAARELILAFLPPRVSGEMEKNPAKSR